MIVVVPPSRAGPTNKSPHFGLFSMMVSPCVPCSGGSWNPTLAWMLFVLLATSLLFTMDTPFTFQTKEKHLLFILWSSYSYHKWDFDLQWNNFPGPPQTNYVCPLQSETCSSLSWELWCHQWLCLQHCYCSKCCLMMPPFSW